jgi:thiol-disulfide isomerase/thioredoxin
LKSSIVNFIIAAIFTLIFIFSGAISWPFQICTIAITTFFAVQYFLRRTSILLTIVYLSPIYLIYSAHSIYNKFIHVYPIVLIFPLTFALSAFLSVKIRAYKQVATATSFLLLFSLPLWLLMEQWVGYTNDYTDRFLTGKPLPNIYVSNFNGDKIELAQTNDTLIVLDAWSTNCGSCFKSFKNYSALITHYADKPVKFYTLNVPIKKDSIHKTKSLIQQYFSNNNLIVSSTEDVSALNINAVPEIILIKNGVIRWKGNASLKREYLLSDLYDKIDDEIGQSK